MILSLSLGSEGKSPMARSASATRTKTKARTSSAKPRSSSSTSSALARRPGSTVSKKKYEDLAARTKRLQAKARESNGNTQEDALIAVGVAVALAAAEKEGKELPTVANLDPALIYGVLGAVIAPNFIKGPWSQRIESAGVGLLTVAAHRSMLRGSVKTKTDEEIAADKAAKEAAKVAHRAM